MMTILAISIFFSPNMPLITLAATFFFGVRHLVDLLNLLTVYRKELESQGNMIEIAMNSCIVIVVAYQIGMIMFAHFNNLPLCSLVCTMILLFTVFYVAATSKPVNYKIRNITSERLSVKLSDQELEE